MGETASWKTKNVLHPESQYVNSNPAGVIFCCLNGPFLAETDGLGICKKSYWFYGKIEIIRSHHCVYYCFVVWVGSFC